MRCLPRRICKNGDIVEETGACDSLSGSCLYVEASVDPCGALACVDANCVDLCADGPGCPRPADVCDGQVAIRHASEGRCEPRTGQCDYGPVRSEVRCGVDEICDAGQCAAHCAVTGCPRRSPSCDGLVQVADRRGGACDAVTGLCDYSAAIRRVDCEARNQICEAGECVDSSPIQPRPGDLVITEIMLDPQAVAGAAGHWFEVYNASPRFLVLNGLEVFTAAGRSVLPEEGDARLLPGEFRVLSSTPVPAQNGGIADVLELPGFAFARTNDFLRIEVEAFLANDFGLGDHWTVDEVRVVPAGFGARPGASVQLDAALGFATENGNPGAWCAGASAYGAGDLGTPGQPNRVCVFEVTELPLRALRDPADPARPPIGTRVRVRDSIVSATNGVSRVWIQAPQPDLYSAINLFVSGQDISGLRPGDRVDVEGIFNDFFGNAQLIATRIDVVRGGPAPDPVTVPVGLLLDPQTAEGYESLLLRVEQLAVTSANPDAPEDFGEIEVAGGLRVDDSMYRVPPPVDVGTTFDALVGVLDFSFGAYKLQPRGARDVVGRFGLGVRPPDVEIRDFAFSPGEISTPAGAGVRFINFDRAAHTVTSGLRGAPDAGVLFDSGLLRSGDSVTIVPPGSGEFPYFCRSHAHEGEALRITVRPDCPEACLEYAGCLGRGEGGACALAGAAPGADFLAGACEATCAPGGETERTCAPSRDAVTVAACGRSLCGQILDANAMANCVPAGAGACAALPSAFFRCLGRESGGAVDAATICGAARACGDLALPQ